MRDWRIYADFAQRLISIVRLLYAPDDMGLELNNTVYAPNTTIIYLCLSVFPWAPFRATKAAVKLHTLLDLRGNIPNFIHISDGKLHESTRLTACYQRPERFMSWIVVLRVLRDCTTLSFFVIHGKFNLKFTHQPSQAVERSTGLICDQMVVLSGSRSTKVYDAALRRIRFKEPESGKTLVFHAHHFALPALTITKIYRCRWQVELFFKWIKKHLRIMKFYRF